MWGLGCLIWEVFNGVINSPSSLKSLGNIPKLLAPVYCELVGALPNSRPNPSEVIQKCRKAGGYFHNDLVESLLFLEEIQIKEANDKTRFFSSLPSLLDSFPENLSRHKILPQLINAFDFGNAGSAILAPMFKLGSLLSEDEYQKKIVPCVIKLFSSPDRATRARLLQQLEFFAHHLQTNTVNDQIFPHVVNGFVDSNPVIREHTVKSILFLAPKLNYNNLNVEVLRHFARLQASDDQGGIRTNTTVCLGKVASFLHPQIRQKVLVSAFTRALRDPFPPARIAGLMALAATQHYYALNQIAQSVLPSLCGLACDPEREVRDQAFKVIKGFLGKLEKVSEDPSLKESMEADVNANASSDASQAASTWAGWAVNAVTSKFYKSKSVDKSAADSSESNLPSPTKSVVTAAAATATKSAQQTTKTNSDGTDEENVSDAEANWESNDWGDMNLSLSAAGQEKEEDGWNVDDEDWAPLETAASLSTASRKNTGSTTASQPSISFTPTTVSSRKTEPPASSNWTSSENATVKSDNNWDSSWNDTTEWKMNDSTALEKDEARRKREEKRNQRQKELEAKRNARQGPMKLGAKKVAND